MKVKVKNLDKALKSIKKDILDTTERSGVLNEAAQMSMEAIRQKTRAGLSMANTNPQGRATKLPPLSKSYQEFRKGKVSFYKGKQGQTYPVNEASDKLNDVDPQYFRPTFANNTLTGQLLKALKYRITSKTSFEIFVANTRREGDDHTNKEVAQFLKDQGRGFLGIDSPTTERIKQLWLRAYRRKIKK